jgi:hypothetical protein
METTNILCPHCGQRLAQLLGEVGQHRRLKVVGKAQVRTGKNALGEEMGWIRCPKCKADKSIDPAHWFGDR